MQNPENWPQEHTSELSLWRNSNILQQQVVQPCNESVHTFIWNCQGAFKALFIGVICAEVPLEPAATWGSSLPCHIATFDPQISCIMHEIPQWCSAWGRLLPPTPVKHLCINASCNHSFQHTWKCCTSEVYCCHTTRTVIILKGISFAWHCDGLRTCIALLHTWTFIALLALWRSSGWMPDGKNHTCDTNAMQGMSDGTGAIEGYARLCSGNESVQRQLALHLSQNCHVAMNTPWKMYRMNRSLHAYRNKTSQLSMQLLASARAVMRIPLVKAL